MVRPSGTEPKIKVYLFANGRDRASAQKILDQTRQGLECYLK